MRLVVRCTLTLVLVIALAHGEMLLEVVSYFSGKFSTEWQAKTKAKATDLRTATTRLWPARTDGIWLYSQVKLGNGDMYRSRVMQLRKEGNVVMLSEFSTKEDRVPLLETELKKILWCDIYITRVDKDMFKGAIRPGGCRDDHKGASFVTQDIVLNRWRIVRTRFRFDGNGTQVKTEFDNPEEHVRVE